MDNFEDKFKQNANLRGDRQHLNSDPIIQAGDDSSRSHEKSQPTEIVHSTKEPISINDPTLLPNQFMRSGEPISSINVLYSLFRLKWKLLALFFLIAIPAITYIWTQIVFKYRARAELRIRPIVPYLVFRTEDNGMIPLYDSFVNTQVSVIRSERVLLRVLDQQKIQQTQWYKNAPPMSLKQRLLGHPDSTHIERLRSALSVRPRLRTEIIDLGFICSNSNEAKLILDTILEQYLTYIGETSNKTRDKLYSQLVDQYKSLENEINGRENICAELRKSLGTATPEEFISMMRIRLADTQARISELRTDIGVLEWKLKNAATDDSNDVLDASNQATERQKKYYEDQEWRGLDRNVRTIQHQIATSLLTPKHPNRAKMEMDLKFAEELLQIREEQLDEQWRDQSKNTAIIPITINNVIDPNTNNISISIENQLEQAKEKEKILLGELNKQKAEFERLFENSQLLYEENKELEHKRSLFNTVRARLDQKNMERNISGTIEVLTPSVASSNPINDRRLVFSVFTLVMCSGISGGMMLLIALRKQTIHTHKDMPYPMQIPFLGYIPTNHTRKAMEKEFNPAMIESIRIVRTALLSRLNGHTSSCVLITSADASTGKSTFTLMLGKSLAQVGKRVLIIDADFRKITLTKRFNLPDKAGFLESLSSRSVDKRYIFPTETFGLSIMPTGKRSNEDTVFEETANGAFKACINQLQKQYNIILLDSSPILPVADAIILSSQVDGTIMVERENVSQRPNVINALARLISAGGRLLGTVFVGSRNSEGYKYNYHYYSRTSES